MSFGNKRSNFGRSGFGRSSFGNKNYRSRKDADETEEIGESAEKIEKAEPTSIGGGRRVVSLAGGTITKIMIQANNPNRASVFVDSEYAFSLNKNVVIDNGLRSGVTVSAEQVKVMTEADASATLQEAAMKLIALRPRSEFELRTRLKQRYPADVAALDNAIARLKDLRYVNDLDFARFWLENRNAFSPRGTRMLRDELRQKGLDRVTIDEALAAFDLDHPDPEEDEAEIDAPEGKGLQMTQALDLARKKARTYARDEKQAFLRKLSSALLRRGYGYDIAMPVARQVWDETHGD